MPDHNRVNILKIIILCISIIEIYYVYVGWQRRKKTQRILKHKDRIEESALQIENIFSFEKYFCFNDEQLFVKTYQEVRDLIPSGFSKFPLPKDLISQLSRFV
jgi:ABC-type transport system involved in Fe-S cluster assembly fused permease/ATPase subunit